jgi:2-phosphosulfolactate phosphatase
VKVRVYFSPNTLDEIDLRDKTIVVIDVLRASTTITYAMNAGAREVIPVSSVDQAMKIVGNLFSTSTILCGERGGKRIEGFKLGNSPSEYTKEAVEGKALILTTTNGAVALTKAKHARHCFVGSFVNLSAVVRALSELPDLRETGLVIICSGREDDFSLEDAVCAGLMLTKLAEKLPDMELTDSARTVLSVYREYGNDILGTLMESEHGKYLASIGFSEDIKTASELDSVPIVPILEQTVIKKKLSFSDQ